MAGGVAEWFKAAVSKTVVRLWAYRGFESHPLRQEPEPGTWHPEPRRLLVCRLLVPGSVALRGGVPEWTNGHAWRACVPSGTVGSNPTPSATHPSASPTPQAMEQLSI